MGERLVVVEIGYPEPGMRVVDESGVTGIISGYNAVGHPVMLPDDAYLGHELLPGEVVTTLPTPDDP